MSLEHARPSRDDKPRDPEPSYSISAFCAVEEMSRDKLYRLWRQGIGPAFYMCGNVRRISHRARLEWQKKMEVK